MKSPLRTALSALALAATFIAIPALADMMNSRATLSHVERMRPTGTKSFGTSDLILAGRANLE